MAENSLDTEVRDLLEKRRGDWQSIVEGAEVSHSWLSKFFRGEIPNPGYSTLKKVHECLTAKAHKRRKDSTRAA